MMSVVLAGRTAIQRNTLPAYRNMKEAGVFVILALVASAWASSGEFRSSFDVGYIKISYLDAERNVEEV
jgi:hypothetical protein